MNATMQQQEIEDFTTEEQFFKANIFNLHLQPHTTKRKFGKFIIHHDMTLRFRGRHHRKEGKAAHS